AVFILWGGHLAQSAYWNEFIGGSPNGSSQVRGAPWHMRTQNLTDNGVTSGSHNQDRSIQPSALLASPTLSTVIFNAATSQPVSGAVPLGTSVYDTATLTGASSPTGTVTYEFFSTIDGTGPPVDQTVTLSGGTVPNSADTAALAAGAYSYVAVYSGDSHNNPATGAVEPLTINKGNTSTATVIKDAGGGAVTGALGESVHD